MTDDEAMVIAQMVKQVVDEVVGARAEQIYLAMEQMREEFQATVGVLDGNDHAVIAELQRMKQTAPAQLLEEVERSWEWFIRGEAERMGMRVIVKKEVTPDPAIYSSGRVIEGKAHGEIVVEGESG